MYLMHDTRRFSLSIGRLRDKELNWPDSVNFYRVKYFSRSPVIFTREQITRIRLE